MPVVRVGNAPCSWGTLEFDEAKAEQIGYGDRVRTDLETKVAVFQNQDRAIRLRLNFLHTVERPPLSSEWKNVRGAK